MRHLLDSTDLTTQEIEKIVLRALDIIAHPQQYAEVCKGKKLATLFYEPSTRTRLSFTAAMMELGGQVLGFSDARSSSVSKGETVADTVRVVSAFADIIAMRHYKEGAPRVASEFSRIPVINAGDGGHSHPTQTMTDLLTIRRELGRFENLTIGLCGDLKYGRTVHSLIKAMRRYEGVRFVLIAPKELALPDYMKAELGDAYTEVSTLEEAMPIVDVLYMTRVQQERFADKDEYERLKDSFILDERLMALGKPSMIVLHPLPRVNEITIGVNGKYVRKAIIYTLLSDEYLHAEPTGHHGEASNCACHNDRCIATTEPVEQKAYIDADGVKRCFYCDHML